MSGDLRRILVACRGELAKRLIATYHALGIEAVVAFSAAEPSAPYLEDADYDVYLGDGDQKVWSDVGRVVAAAMDAGCDAVHPGHGEIARMLELYAAAGAVNLAVIGVDPRRASEALDRVRVIVAVDGAGFDIPPWDVVPSGSDGFEAAVQVGIPLVVVGVDGRAERRVDGFSDVPAAVAAVRGGADEPVLLIHTVDAATSIEVVIAGDRGGRVIPLGMLVGGEIVELAIDDPYPWLAIRSVRIAEQMGFVGIGSVRYRMTSGETAWFVGFDPHLPVAYDLVERVLGIDILELQHALVTGRPAGDPPQRVAHGIQAQVWSQGAGEIAAFEAPRVEGVDVASVLVEGTTIGPDADPLLAKLTASGPDRISARATLWEALHGLRLEGVPTRLAELRQSFGPPIANA